MCFSFSISEEEKTRCLKDPLCYWNWFADFCVCFENPCQTLYCYPDADISDDKCECSKLMCHWSGSAESCYFGVDSSGTTCCICRTNLTYPLANIEKFIKKECDEESRESCGPGKVLFNSLELYSAIKAVVKKICRRGNCGLIFFFNYYYHIFQSFFL